MNRLVPVHKVSDLTTEGAHLERELLLVKVRGTGDKRVWSETGCACVLVTSTKDKLT